MARKGKVKRIKIAKDPVYGNVMLTRLINRSMYDGKKSVAESQVYKALEIIAEKTKEDAISIFEKALENVRPEMEVRARRVGGAAYQVPMQVRPERRDSLALRWIVNAARNRSNSEFHTYAEKLAAELIDATNGEGGAMKKRQDMEKQAEANKAFSHFRW